MPPVRANLLGFPIREIVRIPIVEITRFIRRAEQTSPASRYGLGEIQRMEASKLINGSRARVLGKRSGPAPKSGQPSTVPSEAKKVGKTATKKAKTERPQLKAIRKSKTEKLVCRYCGSDDLAPSFIKRRDRRCRKCFSKSYGSTARTKKTKVKK
jgi:hypothetical protein